MDSTRRSLIYLCPATKAGLFVPHCLFAVIALLMAACSSDNGTLPEPDVKKQVIVLFSPGGLGDQSYNDCILEGVQTFKKEWHDRVDVYIYCPGSVEEGKRVFSDWLALPGDRTPALFVVASSDYEPMIEECLARNELTGQQQVLLFESSNTRRLPVSTFQISMFGPSYIAGKTVSEIGMTSPLIVLANPSDSPIRAAADGFRAGFGDGSEICYLADDWTGYVAASETYRNMSDWSRSHDFIFSVAGGSNSGIYRYSRENSCLPLLAGMDVDQSPLSAAIIGSVIKNIDRAIMEYLSDWAISGKLPESQVYGLESGYSDWYVAPGYPMLEEIKSKYLQEAIRKEKEYHEIP